MSEMEKEYIRIEDEKFLKLSSKCPWKNLKCPNKYRYPCIKEECAVWYFFKSLTE